MLRPGLGRELARVGGEKCERRVIVPPVLGEVEVHTSDEMPRRAPALEKRLERRLRFSELRPERLGDLGPDRFEDRGREVFGAGHRRRRRREGLELAERGRGYGGGVRVEIGVGTDLRNQPRGEIAPVAHVGWKRGPDLADAELEQSVARATSERLFEPAREGRR